MPLHLICVQAVKFGVALGMHVTVISRSRAKFAEAKALGAHAYLVSSDPDSMAAAAGSLAGIIDTVSDTHDVAALMGLLDVDGTVAWVGAPAAGAVMPIPYFNLLFKRQKIGGSLIGGIKETQEMLDFW